MIKLGRIRPMGRVACMGRSEKCL